jgi:hypothetical protein
LVHNEIGNEIEGNESSDLRELNPDIGTEEVTGLKLLRNFDFHFMAWAYIMCASLQLAFQVRMFEIIHY